MHPHTTPSQSIIAHLLFITYLLTVMNTLYYIIIDDTNNDMLSRERPYQHDSTASRLLSEVKNVRAWLVLRWGTTLESQVLFSIFFLRVFCFYFLLEIYLLLLHT